MDYEFDAPKFYDFDKPAMYEDAYNDDWFEDRLEDDMPIAPEPSARRPRRSVLTDGVPNKPQRVLKPQPQSSSYEGPTVECQESQNSATRNPKPSPKKIQRLSKEAKSSPASNPIINTDPSALSSTVTSPSSNTRLRKRTSAEIVDMPCKSPPNTTNQRESPMLQSQSESPIPAKTKTSHSGARPKEMFRSPVKKAKSPTSRLPPKSPLRRSPRKAVKSPFKAPKALQSPHAQRTASKFSSMTNLHRINTSIESKSSQSGAKPLGRSGSFSRPRGTSPQMKKAMSTANLKGKSSEQMEMEKIAEMKRGLAKTRKAAQDSYKKAMKSSAYMPVRSNQPATLPEGFHFKTDSRLKNPTTSTDFKVKDFTKSLRDALPQSNLPSKPQIHGLTKPQPFKLSSAKSTSTLQSTKYKSDAEKALAFHNRTPDRFRSQPKGAKPLVRSGSFSRVEGSKRGHSPVGLTVAKTPTLTTRGRNRPARHIPTQEEKEQREWEEHKQKQFKANPVNTKILEKTAGLHKVAPKSLTVPEEFNLYQRHAVSSSDLRVREEEERYEFHAKPVNPRIMQGTTGVKRAEPLPVTVPESPAFASKYRVRIPAEVPRMEESNKAPARSHPVPHPGVPFRPKLEKQFTVPEPFMVEERSKQMMTRRDVKIQQVYDDEKRAREFHASGYTATPDSLPAKQERPITEPQPFHLSADERGQRYKEEFFSKVEEEERQAKEATKFRAGPCDVTRADPFMPQKSNKPLTEISDFNLNTDQRVNQREVFDQHIKAREAELEGLKRQREERNDRERGEEVARMRQAAVHQAQGIKKYKSVIVKPSDKPLTDAHSPLFSQRSRNRQNVSDL